MADDDKRLIVLRKRFTRCLDASDESRLSQLDDVKFAAGSSDNKWQWDTVAIATRQPEGTTSIARPALTINLLPQHIRQVTNEERQNRPAGRVLPVDDKADPKVAEVFNGLIRHIEVSSDSDIAIDTACECQVTSGEGFFRIVAEYDDPMSFDQDLRIKRIRNPFSVYMDPDIKDPTGADAKFCFIVDELTKEEFESQFPDANVVSFDQQGTGDEMNRWFSNDLIRVAEYYRVEMVKKTICQWPDGMVTVKDSPESAAYMGQKPLAERVTAIPQVKWFKTNGFQILGTEKDVPGKFIPVFRVVGNEWVVEGQTVVSGIVRNAKDPQRMVNYWTSQEAELLALAPKAPFVGASGQFQGFETKWDRANVIPYSYLEYNPVIEDGVQVPPPQRMAPPMPAAGLIEAKMQAIHAVQQTTGQYNASLGERSNETSGKAILARQREGDVGTYHYVDNLARAVRAYCRYLVDVIPVYYDRRRVARILGEDGEPDHAIIDPQQPEAYTAKQDENGKVIEEIYNPSVGKYDVVSSVGPSYTTKRQEGAEFMTQVLQGNKELMSVIGDLYFRMLDVAGADEIADRLKRAVPPNLLGEEGSDDPRVEQGMQMIEQLTQEVQGLSQQLEGAEEQRKNYEAKTKRLQIMIDKIPPDLLPEIFFSSDLMDATGYQNVSERGIAPPMEEPEMGMSPKKPPNGSALPAQ